MQMRYPPPHSIERYNRQADHRQQAPRHDKIYHFVGLCRQIQLADLHPCIQPQQMNRDPHGVIDQQLQSDLNGKIIRVKSKTAEQHGVHRIGLGIDQL